MSINLNHYISGIVLVSLLLIGGTLGMSADVGVEYSASLSVQASTGRFSPYMLGSWNRGRYAEGNGIWQEAGVIKPLDLSRRFSWGAGAGYIAGLKSKESYARWDRETDTWGRNVAVRNAAWITQLFAQVKFRGIYMTLGMKDTKSKIVDDDLSSGDLIRSNNFTPIPGIAGGFVDFQDIPLTKGWLQIDGEVMYGKMMDSGFKRNEFNYNYGDLSQDVWYNYKRCYFRTNPHKNFYITIGMQAAGMFAGSMRKFKDGEVYNRMDRGFRIADVFQMLFPREGGENYYTGSHLGSWDFKADCRLRDGSRLSAYFEWPWEDGSGIGRMNGWDGLWGVQYVFPHKGPVSKIVVEYLDFTNQSGPLHYAPGDNPINPVSGQAEGADDYYNNAYYGAYANYGMAMGTPFLLSPIYNSNGDLTFLHNRARGFHMAMEGHPADWISFCVKGGYELAGGKGPIPAYRKLRCLSGMASVKARPFRKLPDLEMGLRVAFDKGSLRGDNFGAQLNITYRGLYNIKKSQR